MEMKYVPFGRTGMSVSAASLGCGGYSRIGSRKYGNAHSVELVRYAYDRGINYFDSAIQYETMPLVSAGLAGLPRDSYILASKCQISQEPFNDPKKLEFYVDQCLTDLRTDYLDIFYMHGIAPESYKTVRDDFYVEYEKMRDKGKIRFIGITEAFNRDPHHKMLETALADDLFDVIMLGYNILNPSAREKVLPMAKERNTGVVCMYPIRRPFYHRETLLEMLAEQRAKGNIAEDVIDLDWLLEDGCVRSLAEAGCRYSAAGQGIHAVLTGPGSKEHLDENIAATLGPPLPDEIAEKLYQIFRNSDAVSVL